MPNNYSEEFFEVLTSRLRTAGIPNGQTQLFVERCREAAECGLLSADIFLDGRLPEDDCFRTLAEAQRIFELNTGISEYVKELDPIERYLMVPYGDVLEAKRAMSEAFNQSEDEVEAAYAQGPEWLFISADSVKEFASFLNAEFPDSRFVWDIYKNAALLGPDCAQYRIKRVLEMLGRDIGEMVIQNDIQGDAWLFYRWFTDPVGCIEYMLECGLTPEKVYNLLEKEPSFLFEYKEDRKQKYNHDQEYIDAVIGRYRGRKE